MKNIILCDLDGTLANVGHRLHYLKNPDGTMKPQKERDWGSFHKACVDDAPYEDVIEVVSSVFNARQDNDLYILSGRNEVVREETEAWLCKHFPDYYEPDPTVDSCDIYVCVRLTTFDRTLKSNWIWYGNLVSRRTTCCVSLMTASVWWICGGRMASAVCK